MPDSRPIASRPLPDANPVAGVPTASPAFGRRRRPGDPTQVHELATNAAKYGALSVGAGQVDIAWTIAGSNPARLQLVWVEKDGPEVTQLSRRGFGMELIERSIPFELKGEAKLEIADKAVRCTIVIPGSPEHFTFGSTAAATK